MARRAGGRGPGPAKPAKAPVDWEAMRVGCQEEYQKAIREGRHKPGPALQVCHLCREWREIFHVNPQGGERMCWDCAPEAERQKVYNAQQERNRSAY